MGILDRSSLLAVLGLVFLREVYLVIDRVVVVPVFLAANIIPHTEKHRFAFEIGLVSKLDVEGEAIVTVLDLSNANIIVILGHDLGSGFPVVQSEARHNQFVKREVTDCHATQEHPGIWRKVYLFRSNGPR